jgi:choline kinase
VSITCLLAIPNNSLLDRALESIISSGNSEIKLITSAAKNLTELVEEISDLEANIVILAESLPLAAKDTLVSLLMSFTELRVIVVSEDTNWLHVFHKRDMLMNRQADFKDAIYFDCLDQVSMG